MAVDGESHSHWFRPTPKERYLFIRSFILFYFIYFILFYEFCLFRVTPAAFGGSQMGKAMGQIRAVATGLCHRHSNVRSEPRLQPTPQLTAMLDP